MVHHWSSGIVARRQAWHGLARVRYEGFRFDDPDVIRETDYTVEKLPLLAQFADLGDPTTPDDIVNLPGQYVLGTRSLPADGTRRTYGTVSDRYQILQPCEVREYAQRLCDVGEGLARPETCIVLRDGMDYVACVDIGSLTVPEPMQAFAMISSRYDGATSVQVSASLIATVCANTQAAALREHHIRIPHTSVMHGELGEAMQTITEAMQAARDYGHALLPLVKARLTGSEFVRAVRIAAQAATETYALPEDPQERILAERRLARFVERLVNAAMAPQGQTEQRDQTAYGITQAAFDALEYTGRKGTNSLGRAIDGTLGESQARVLKAIQEVYA